MLKAIATIPHDMVIIMRAGAAKLIRARQALRKSVVTLRTKFIIWNRIYCILVLHFT